jgi:hypothetical protein
MTLKGTVNSRILNLVIYVDNIKLAIICVFNKVPVSSRIRLFRSNKRERNADNRKSPCPHYIRLFTQNVYKEFPDINYAVTDTE